MSECFQNIMYLSLVLGGILGILCISVPILRRFCSSKSCYFLWLILAIRLLIPFSVSFVSITDLNLFQISEQNQVKQVPMEQIKTENNSKSKKIKTVEQKEKGNETVFESEKDEELITQEQKVSVEEKSTVAIVLQILLHFVKANLKKIGAFIWMLGMVVVFYYRLLAYLAVYYKRRRWEQHASKEMQSVFEEIKEEVLPGKKVLLRVTSDITSPMSMGIFQKIVFMPEREYSLEKAEFIFRHELTHCKHHDISYLLLQSMVRVVYWFHPLVHWMYQQAVFDMESYCDAEIVEQKGMEYRSAYGFTLLDSMLSQKQRDQISLTTCFSGGKKHMKKRFQNIMSETSKKYGKMMLAAGMAMTLMVTSIGCGTKDEKTVENQQATSASADKSQIELTGTKHILINGLDCVGGTERTDLVLLVTLDSEKKECVITNIDRSVSADIPGHGTGTVSSAYGYGGMKLEKQTIENLMNISVDTCVNVRYKSCKAIINALGGIEIDLTKKEADYLNSTNYIANKKYRNVKEGKQVLNGAQVLGYARVRQIPSANGKFNTLGRAERTKAVLNAIFTKCQSMDATTWLKVGKEVWKALDVTGADLFDDTQKIEEASNYLEYGSEIFFKEYTLKMDNLSE